MLTLVEKASSSQKDEDGFQGFDSQPEESEVPEERDPEEGMILSESAVQSEMQQEPSVSVKQDFKESELRIMIDQVVDRMTPIIQACCVTDRVEKAERNADEWKSLANLMLTNPQFASQKLSMSNLGLGAKVTPTLGRHPMDQNWEMFLHSPLAAPIWTLILKFDLHPTSSTFTKWWKKVKGQKNRQE